jgi:hypothetical protein
MSMKRFFARWRRSIPTMLVALALVPHAASAKAKRAPHAKTKPVPAACTAAYHRAQSLEQASQLREAEKVWLSCARPTCGAFLAHECTFRHAQVEGDIPSLVPTLSDAQGTPITDAQVSIDGVLLTHRMEGRAFPVDPGIHALTFRNGQGLLAEEKVVVSQGQRNRLIAVKLPGPPEDPATGDREPGRAPAALDLRPTAMVEPDVSAAAADKSLGESPPVTRRSGARVAPWLLGGLGVAGLAGFGVLTYWGRQDNDRLATCSPRCPPASVEHIRRLYLGANVALGVGLAALVGATWIGLSGGDEVTHDGRYVFDVQPGADGVRASWRGRF